jgi:hypothetical protein
VRIPSGLGCADRRTRSCIHLTTDIRSFRLSKEASHSFGHHSIGLWRRSAGLSSGPSLHLPSTPRVSPSESTRMKHNWISIRDSSLCRYCTSACTIAVLLCTSTSSTKRPCKVAFWPGGCDVQFQTQRHTLQAAQLCVRHTGRLLSRATQTKEIGLLMQSSRIRIGASVQETSLLLYSFRTVKDTGIRRPSARPHRWTLWIGRHQRIGVRQGDLSCMRVHHAFTANTLGLVGAHRARRDERLRPWLAGQSKRPIRRPADPHGLC